MEWQSPLESALMEYQFQNTTMFYEYYNSVLQDRIKGNMLLLLIFLSNINYYTWQYQLSIGTSYLGTLKSIVSTIANVHFGEDAGCRLPFL